jgi:hypothetical protein
VVRIELVASRPTTSDPDGTTHALGRLVEDLIAAAC